MAGDPSKMTIWTGYFDIRTSRTGGRRVSKEASIPNPTLDAIVWAARDAGITKMKRDAEVSHPARPYAKEGRLILSSADAKNSTGADSKEGVIQSIGHRLRSQYKASKSTDGSASPGKKPQRGGAQRSQRKSFKGKSSGQKKKKFGRR
jgi:signal recognition particle subunit SEC65